MGLVYIYLHLLNIFSIKTPTIHVGKYTVCPMDGMGVYLFIYLFIYLYIYIYTP